MLDNVSNLTVPFVATQVKDIQTGKSRLARLEELSLRPEYELDSDQKNEKRRILKLEKNRNAAAISRKKKKMYISNLEEYAASVAKKLAALEMENYQLKSMLAKFSNQHLETLPPHTAASLRVFDSLSKEDYIELNDTDECSSLNKKRKLNYKQTESKLGNVGSSLQGISSFSLSQNNIDIIKNHESNNSNGISSSNLLPPPLLPFSEKPLHLQPISENGNSSPISFNNNTLSISSQRPYHPVEASRGIALSFVNNLSPISFSTSMNASFGCTMPKYIQNSHSIQIPSPPELIPIEEKVIETEEECGCVVPLNLSQESNTKFQSQYNIEGFNINDQHQKNIASISPLTFRNIKLQNESSYRIPTNSTMKEIGISDSRTTYNYYNYSGFESNISPTIVKESTLLHGNMNDIEQIDKSANEGNKEYGAFRIPHVFC